MKAPKLLNTLGIALLAVLFSVLLTGCPGNRGGDGNGGTPLPPPPVPGGPGFPGGPGVFPAQFNVPYAQALGKFSTSMEVIFQVNSASVMGPGSNQVYILGQMVLNRPESLGFSCPQLQPGPYSINSTQPVSLNFPQSIQNGAPLQIMGPLGPMTARLQFGQINSGFSTSSILQPGAQFNYSLAGDLIIESVGGISCPYSVMTTFTLSP